MKGLLFIKSSNVHTFREVVCHVEGCGYWINPDDHSMQGSPRLAMFKVNGFQTCEACLKETVEEIQEWLEVVSQ